MWRFVAQRRFVWIGIALMLVQLLAPALSHALRHHTASEMARSMALADDLCLSPPAVGAEHGSPLPLPDGLNLKACGYCDTAPAEFAGLPSPVLTLVALPQTGWLTPQSREQAQTTPAIAWGPSPRAAPAV
jgi:hypothetical protein